MDFDLTSDQKVLLDAVDGLLGSYRDQLPGGSDYVLNGDAVRSELVEAGYFALIKEGLTPLDAVLVIEKVAQLPHAVEVGASLLVAPLLGIESNEQAVAFVDAPDAPARFLDIAAAAFVDDGRDVHYVSLPEGIAVRERSLYAYQFGRLTRPIEGPRSPVDREAFLTWRYIAQSAEILGAMHSALSITVEYVKTRQQFGRPIGAFQVIQHRLSEAAALQYGVRLLTYRAAASGTLDDAASAIIAAKEAARLVAYEAQQFHGAIGLSLEYPLHCWTYKLRSLVGEGGSAATIAATHVQRPDLVNQPVDLRSIFEVL